MNNTKIFQARLDNSSYYGGIFTKDYTIGDVITWLGHDGVFGYLYGEDFLCTKEHMEYTDFPVYRRIGTYDIRGTIFLNDETFYSISKRDPWMGIKAIFKSLLT